MNEIHKAYIVLGLEPGSSYEDIKEAYQLLISGLHPDKHKGEKKEKAEEKAKQINNAKDILDKHFEEDHKEGANCLCQPTKTEAKSNYTDSPESNTSSTSSKAERAERARQREAEREQEDSAKSDYFNTNSSEDSNKEPIFSDDLAYAYYFDEAKKRAKLYWKVTLVAFVLFLGCFAWGNMVNGMYDTGELRGKDLTDKEKKVYGDWNKYQNEKMQLVEKIAGKRPTEESIRNWQPPFEPKYKRLKASVERHRTHKQFYDTSPHYWTAPSTDPGAYSGEKRQLIKELNRNITFFQGQMDKWKRKVDEYDAFMSHGATSLDVQTKRDNAHSNYVSFKNKRDNAKRQLNNMTKKQPSLKDLSNPYYYSKDKNPFGAGTKPPSPKSQYLIQDRIDTQNKLDYTR